VRARVAPRLGKVAFVRQAVVAPEGVRPDLHRAAIAQHQRLYALERVKGGLLVKRGHLEAGVGVRALDRPEIGKSRHHAAKVGTRPILGP
jgi:hypothetical protein